MRLLMESLGPLVMKARTRTKDSRGGPSFAQERHRARLPGRRKARFVRAGSTCSRLAPPATRCYVSPVSRVFGRGRVLAFLVLAGWSGVATAQMPVCPQPDPVAPVWSVCSPTGRYLAISFLSNLTIDQLLRADGKPIERRPRDVFESVVDGDTLAAQSVLVDWLGGLGSLKFSRMDTATGTLAMDTPQERRNFSSTLPVGGLGYDVTIDVPERIEGGYWRTPGVLQMAFWKDRRAKVGVKTPFAGTFEGEIDCAVVSADGIRLMTAGEGTPDVLVGFGPCP